jgi:hypothetical protein
LLGEIEVQEILANPERYIPKPKNADRKLPKHVSTHGDGFRVDLKRNGHKIYKSFQNVSDAVAFRNKTLQEIQDEMVAKLYGTLIVRNAAGVAIIKVKVPKKDEYVYAKVSDQDYYDVVQHKWRLNNGYASNGKTEMHCFIMKNTDKTKHVDHTHHDTLDNQRENLRIVSHSFSARHKRKREGTPSQYVGVTKEGNKCYMSARWQGAS